MGSSVLVLRSLLLFSSIRLSSAASKGKYPLYQWRSCSTPNVLADDDHENLDLYGLKPIYKETRSLSIDPLDYGENKNYFEAGKRITAVCKGVSKNQKVEWVDPEGNVVQRDVKNRVYAQEHFVSSQRTRAPALLLVLSHAVVKDTGVWKCHSGDMEREVSICIIDPASFVDTVTEVIVDHGRSITLSCQARGDPEPRLTWYRNGVIITDDLDASKYQLMTKFNSQGFEGLLTITSLDNYDSGEYICGAIQESPLIGDCSANIRMNITLHVNFPPMFADGNDTALVPGEENKSVDLVCAAEGYPTPTYRWFKEIGDILSEYPKDAILLQDDGSKAVLNLIANASTFGQKYRCRATNEYGDADKTFSLLKLEKPREPDEITLVNATHDLLYFYAKWDGEVLFPVDVITVQYLKKNFLKRKGVPKDVDWKKATEIDVKTEEYDLINDDPAGLYVTLSDLDEEMEYWIRFRAVNGAGTSSWTSPISASTVDKSEEEEESKDEEETTEEVDNDEEPTSAAQLSDSTFYGVFFAGAIIVVGVGCMFAMRMV